MLKLGNSVSSETNSAILNKITTKTIEISELSVTLCRIALYLNPTEISGIELYQGL